MKLTAKAIESAQPREKAWKMFDGGGLHVEIQANGKKYWRLSFRFAGKERRISFGVFPGVSLKEARECAVSAKALLRQGLDPIAQRKLEKQCQVLARAAKERKMWDTVRHHTKLWLKKMLFSEACVSLTRAHLRAMVVLASSYKGHNNGALTLTRAQAR